MKVIFKAIVMIIILWLTSSQAAENTAFLYEIQKMGEKYESLANSPESIQFIKEGKKSAVNTRLKTLVPDKNKTAADYFILSNMLYRTDIAASDSYIKMADDLSPENPFILFERAMHEHRAGNCKAALPLYERVSLKSKEMQSSNKLWGYVTHCRLVIGDYLGAIESWRKADFGNHHTAIEKSMYDIFSSNDPDLEREKLINSISAGTVAGACELIKLDKNWELDWWNIKEKKEYLTHDTEFLKNLANKNTKIDLAIGLCIDSLALNDTEFRKYIAASDYWENKYILPDDPTATYMLINQLVQRKIATPLEILAHYEDQLVKRYTTDPKNQRTLDVLAFLYSQNKVRDKLKGIDIHGWKNLKLQKYAESYIQGISKTDPEYQQTLETAALDFPNSVTIQGANLALHNQSKDRPVYLMKYVAAQFSDVKNNWLGPYRLSDFMTSLEYEAAASINSLEVTDVNADGTTH